MICEGKAARPRQLFTASARPDSKSTPSVTPSSPLATGPLRRDEVAREGLGLRNGEGVCASRDMGLWGVVASPLSRESSSIAR